MAIRVLISTDAQMATAINNIDGDKDDIQSLVHVLLYQDKLDIVGLISSTSRWQPGQNDVRFINHVLDAYEQDWPKLQSRAGFKSPTALRALVKQGTKVMAGTSGLVPATAGSNAIIAAVRASASPTYVVCWGGTGDVARAVADAPDIISKLRLISIYDQEPNANKWLDANFRGGWWIDIMSSYQGWYGTPTSKDPIPQSWATENAKGHGALGELFYQNTFDVRGTGGTHNGVKMGDSPSIGKLINGDPNDPTGVSWGGEYRLVRAGYWTDLTAGAIESVYKHRAAWTGDFAARLDWLRTEVVIPPQPEPETRMAISYNRQVVRQKWEGYHWEFLPAGDPRYPTILKGPPTDLNPASWTKLRKHLTDGAWRIGYKASGFGMFHDAGQIIDGLATENDYHEQRVWDKLKEFFSDIPGFTWWVQWHTAAPFVKTTLARGKGVFRIGPRYAPNPRASLALFAPSRTADHAALGLTTEQAVALWRAQIKDIARYFTQEAVRWTQKTNVPPRYINPLNEAENGAGAMYGTNHPVTGETYEMLCAEFAFQMRAAFPGTELILAPDAWLGSWGANKRALDVAYLEAFSGLSLTGLKTISCAHKIGMWWENADYGRNNKFLGGTEKAGIQQEYEGLSGVHPNGPRFQVLNNILKTMHAIVYQLAPTDNPILHVAKFNHLPDTESGPDAYSAYGFNPDTGELTPSINYWGIPVADRYKPGSYNVPLTGDAQPWGTGRVALLGPDGKMRVAVGNRLWDDAAKLGKPFTVALTTDCPMEAKLYAYQKEGEAFGGIDAAGTKEFIIPPLSAVVWEQSTQGGPIIIDPPTDPDPEPDPPTGGNTVRRVRAFGYASAAGTGVTLGTNNAYGLGERAVPFDPADPTKIVMVEWAITDPAEFYKLPLNQTNGTKLEFKRARGGTFTFTKVEFNNVSHDNPTRTINGVVGPVSLGSAWATWLKATAEVSTADTTRPVISGQKVHSVIEGNLLTFTVTANESVTWAIGEFFSGEAASGATISPAGPSTSATVSVPAYDFEQRQDASFEVVATDAAGNTNEESFQVNVTVVNDPADDRPAPRTKILQYGVNVSAAEHGDISENEDGVDFGPDGPFGDDPADFRMVDDWEIDLWADRGVTIFRLPFKAERAEPYEDEPLNAVFVADLERIVNRVTVHHQIDLLLDCHGYMRRFYHDKVANTWAQFQCDAPSGRYTRQALATMWVKIHDLPFIKNNPRVFIDVMNEPQGLTFETGVTEDQGLARIYDHVRTRLRANGYANLLHLEPANWGKVSRAPGLHDALTAMGSFDPLGEWMSIYHVHQYASSNEAGTNNVAISTNLNWGVERMDDYTTWARGEGVSLFLGEYGLPFNGVTVQKIIQNMLAHIDANPDVWLGDTVWNGERLGRGNSQNVHDWETGINGPVLKSGVRDVLIPRWNALNA